MSPKDAAYATREWIKPKMGASDALLHHPFLKGSPAEYEAALGQPQVDILDMKPGDTRSF